jgi:6-pyruvoyltetrahydropterin/6-carboxytetrahydropterin synthase
VSPSQEKLGQESATQDPICRSERPVVIAVDQVSADQESAFLAAAQVCHCAAYRRVDGPLTSFAVAGTPADLARLRNHLVPLGALAYVREQLERGLAEWAAPGGLPLLKADDYQRRSTDFDSGIPEGTTLLVTREFTFDAAHNLPRYHGKCEFLHGHTFKIQVTVRAPLDPWSGMSFDFHDLKGVVKSRVVDVLDHSYLNELIPNPSAECIALWAWQQLEDLPLHEIKIWETPTSHVTFHGPPKRA